MDKTADLAAENEMKARLLRGLALAAAASAGTGFLMRGLPAMFDRPRGSGFDPRRVSDVDVQVPYVVQRPPKKRVKEAAGANTGRTMGFFRNSEFTPKNWWLDPSGNSPFSIPIAGPALGLAMLAPGMISYDLTNRLIGSSRLKREDEELDRARERYRQEVLATLASRNVKTATADLAASRGYEHTEKQGFDLGEVVAQSPAAAGLAATLLALGTGRMSYEFFKDRSNTEILDKAMTLRDRARVEQQAPTISAVPVRVPAAEVVAAKNLADANKDSTDDDDDEWI